jgi:uncharacterized membrane protein
MSKAIILPILTTIALAVQLIFGVEIPSDVINEASVVIANATLVGITLYGVFKDHKKK